jgi:hypothetical protein
MSRRPGRPAIVVAGLLALALAAGWATWSARSGRPSATTPATVTLAPEATGPAGLTVDDLTGVDQLQTRFNADQGATRLVLALAPT